MAKQKRDGSERTVVISGKLHSATSKASTEHRYTIREIVEAGIQMRLNALAKEKK
jgi:hypothetical protein